MDINTDKELYKIHNTKTYELRRRELSTPPDPELIRTNLRQIFADYLVPLTSTKASLSILSVGCGAGLEVQPLLSLFPQAEYLGVDINDGAIQVARSQNSNMTGNVRFETRDATDQTAFDKSHPDIVIIRHPKIGVDISFDKPEQKEWRRIFQYSIDALASKGIMFVSTFLPQEKDKVLDILQRDGRIVVEKSAANKNAANQNPLDSFLIIGRKV